MSKLPTKSENPNGFHQKYQIAKADGSPVDPDAIYVVLRIDGPGPLARAARNSARDYGKRLVGTSIEQVGEEIIKLCDDLSGAVTP